MSKPVPTTVITGYLGSGKTTLINALLAGDHGFRITVLVNDFGEINIDESLIRNREGDTLSLTNGCMCCSIGGQLYDAIDRILSTNPVPDHLVIETSGVADPDKISQIAIAEPDLHYCSTITLVDALNFHALLADPLLSDTLERQAKRADLLVLAKTDLLDQPSLADQLELLLAGISSATNKVESKSIMRAIRGNIPASLILADRSNPTKADARTENPLLPEKRPGSQNHVALYTSWSMSGFGAMPVDALEAATRPEASGIYRLKGIVTDVEGFCHVVQRSGRDWQVHPMDAKAQNQLVAIGPQSGFDPQKFEARIRKLILN